ncbi:MAG: hypothetical protein Ct9H300mP23_00120 [Nitrospinota bacterium]|nr:MAG: hypothetical protein Ct9H300mP23_00120 [Nitrospinota bacterium]
METPLDRQEPRKVQIYHNSFSPLDRSNCIPDAQQELSDRYQIVTQHICKTFYYFFHGERFKFFKTNSAGFVICPGLKPMPLQYMEMPGRHELASNPIPPGKIPIGRGDHYLIITRTPKSIFGSTQTSCAGRFSQIST